jgi:transposase
LVILDRRILQIVEADPVVQRLCTVPRIGPVTATAFVSTLDQIDRICGAHAVEAYIGLVPCAFSSGERQQRGGLTKAGNPRLRWLLVEAAWSILRYRNPRTDLMREWAEQFAVRRGRRIGVVGLARRLAGILYAMWRDGTTLDQRGANGS